MKDTRYENALLEHFFYQMSLFTSVSWFYYGDAASNSFIGLRRSWPCETNQTCAYAGATVNPSRPALPEGSIVRLLTKAGRLEAYSTSAGSDPAVLLYSEAYDLKVRPWYTGALGGTAGQNAWTDPYPFTGGVLGVTVSRLVKNSAGTTLGVLAADYELTFMHSFLQGIAGLSANTRMFAMTTGSMLVAHNNADLPANDDGQQVSAVSDAAITAVGADVMVKYPIFAQKTADWTGVSETAQRGNLTVGSASYFYDAIGIVDQRWVLLVAFPEAEYYPVTPVAEGACQGKTTLSTCRSLMDASHLDLRQRTLKHFAEYARDYLGAAVAAISSLDTAYNMGNLHAGWCEAGSCGVIRWDNATDTENLRKHIESTLQAYPEVAWLYSGWQTAKKVLGYRTMDGKLQLWRTCDGNPAGCTTGVGFWEDAARTQLVGSALPDFDFATRPWYTKGMTLDSIDKLAWTDPYIFSDGHIGVTLVKKIFNGDWQSTTPEGVWAADYTVSFLTDFLKSSINLAEGSVAYIMDNRGYLVAASEGIPVVSTGTTGEAAEGHLTKAVESTNDQVKSSASLIFPNFALIQTDSIYSALTPEVEGSDDYRMVVDAVRIVDSDTNTVQSYNWALVTVTPSMNVLEEDSEDDSLPVWAWVLFIAGGAALLGCSAAFALYTLRKPSSPAEAGMTDDGPSALMGPPPPVSLGSPPASHTSHTYVPMQPMLGEPPAQTATPSNAPSFSNSQLV
eukprot:TRINITY_DN1915_c0_g1_i4.p1 TRINITY_DN1915_c0_g1~~TRINITY_DN1915_c0_g1_i4.p1  ORF type:complete len:733 (+),score=249.49 TRINITY_DN1915_c0_g1_i4:407-2605(+)